MMKAAPSLIIRDSFRGASGVIRGTPAIPFIAKERYAPTSSSKLVPAPPKITLRLGEASFGKRKRKPALERRAVKRVGPIRSNKSTAGTFKDRCKASETLTGPEKLA